MAYIIVEIKTFNEIDLKIEYICTLSNIGLSSLKS